MTAVGIAAALAVFYILFAAFVMLARDAEPERREVIVREYGHGPAAEEAEFVTDMDVGRIEIYREGDGPAPAWYDPSEPMAAEWSAEEPEQGGFGFNGEPDGKNTGVGTTNDYIIDVPLSEEFQRYLYGLCTEYGVPYTLAIAVIEAESTYRADAVSSDGDYGLMQINWRCLSWLADELGITDFLDAKQNALAGVWILGGYYRRYGYASGALVAYNQGQQSAEALFAAGIYETDYSRRVMEIQRRIENGGAK